MRQSSELAELIGDGTAGTDGAGISGTLTTLLALLSFSHSVRARRRAREKPHRPKPTFNASKPSLEFWNGITKPRLHVVQPMRVGAVGAT